jgi:hypothetical protein
MLRIALHQDGNQCRLELSCKLYAPWVGETETVWRSAACSGERIEVDLRDVTGVDDAGSQLQAAMRRSRICRAGSGDDCSYRRDYRQADVQYQTAQKKVLKDKIPGSGE